MKKGLGLLFTAIASMCLSACNNAPEKDPEIPEIVRTYSKIESDTLYTKKVENMTDDFIIGMDISSVIAQEKSGVKYRNFDGKEEDVFKILSDNGVNYIRVRIWNNPYDDQGKGFGGGNNDLATAIEIGKRATANKMKLLVDFHYSDFWADPAKQESPRAWKNMAIDEKQQALYEFTRDSLKQLRKNGVAVGMVQVGNETNGGKMAGETRFSIFASLLNEGSRAVKEVYPDALVAVHFANPEKTKNYLDYAKQLNQYNVNYDVFGTSYYPYWHGTFDNLSYVLSTIAETYNKKTMVMETSYAFTTEDFDFGGNTIGPGGGVDKPYPLTVAGQANFFRDLVDTIVNKTKNGIGVCYWEGAWISVGGASWEENSAKWETYGSGWAASPAGIYDKDVEEFGPGGSMVDNQTFFSTNGKPIESIKVLNNVRFGNDAPLYVDGVLNEEVLHYTYEDFTLPEKVNIVYSDNSHVAVPVTWEEFDIPAAKAKGNGKYEIKGTVEGYDGYAYCYLTIMEYNYLENYGFENGVNASPWVMTNNNTEQTPKDGTNYIVQPTAENPQSGKYAYHFWAKNANVVNFDVEQEVHLTQSGTYKYQASLLGGSDIYPCTEADQNIYIYVKINDTIVCKQDMKFKGYGEGYSDFLIPSFNYEVGQKLVVGFHVEAKEQGSWGDIDDCMLNIVL